MSTFTRVFSKPILFLLLVVFFSLIHSEDALAISFWDRYTININLADKHGDTYLVGERATFNIGIRRGVLRFSLSRGFYYRYDYYNIPARNLRTTFPDYRTEVGITRTGTGRYEYQTPGLEEIGPQTLTVRIGIRTIFVFLTLARRSYTINVQGPPTIEITDPEDGSLFNTDTITVSGTVNDNEADVEVNEITADVSDHRFSAEVPLEEGENEITAIATNPFGASEDSITVTLDTTPPLNPSININEGAYTNTTTINLTLSAEEANEMIISEDPSFLEAVWESYTTNKAITLSEGDGSKTIYVKYRDIAQNETLPLSDSIILDIALPQLEILSPIDESITNQTQTNVSGTFTEVNLDTITVNGISAEIEENIFMAEGVPLDIEGNNLIRVEAIDLARNPNIYEINVIRDTLPPEIQISNPINNFLTNQREITVTGTFIEANPDTITVNSVAAVIDGNTFTAEGVQLNNEGNNPIRAVITDLAGQTNSHEINIVRDTTPPQNPSITISEGDYTNSTAINLTLSADEAVDMIISESPDFSEAEWEPYVPVRVLTLIPGDGPKTIYAKFRDEIQNETLPVSDTTTLDQIPPQITITTPLDGALTNQREITVTGTYIEANLNTITVNDIMAIITDGAFTLEDFVLVEGDNTITVLATDLASNPDSETIHITLDSTPPQNPNILIEEGNQTDERLIHLHLSAEGASEIIISEEESFAGETWEPYVETREYTLSEGEGLKRVYVKFRDEAGNETGILQDRIVLGHILTITSPTDGLTINSGWISVTGTINGEVIPVYINGLQARIIDNTFYINQFPLEVGENTIIAQAYLEDELLEETSVNILTNELIDPVQITVNPLSGEPVLEVNFTVTTNLENPITNYAWDFDNDGVIDWRSPETGNTSHTYNRVRLYHPTIRITDTNGSNFAATVTINVHLARQSKWSIDIEDPIDLAVDTERNLYILQRTAAQIQKYDVNGNYISTFGGIGQIPGQFTNPCGIALDQSGNIYIADTGNNRLQKLTPLGEPDNTFSEDGVIGINIDSDLDGILDSGSESSQFNQPYGIGVDGESNIYVTDTGNNRIQKFSQTGEFLLQWEVNSPYGISVELMGDIYIANRNNNQIQIYSSMGSSSGVYNDGLFSPTDTALSNNYLYIADTGNNLIRKINRENFLSDSNIETFADGEEVDNLSSPVAIYLDSDPQKEFIYVADSGNIFYGSYLFH